MTELTRQMKREEAWRNGETQHVPVGESCRDKGKKENKSGPIQFKKKKKHTDLQGFTAGSPAAVLSCHCNFIATIWKGPGTFPLPSTWQMTNNSRDNLWPVGGKCVRQRADASAITAIVIVWILRTGYLLGKSVLIRTSELSRGNPPCFLPSAVFSERLAWWEPNGCQVKKK